MAIDPMTALTIARGVGQFMDANNKAAEQERAYRLNRQRAVQSRDLQVQQLNTRAIQEAEMASQQKLQTAIQALKAREARKTIAGESGLAGQTERLKIQQVTADELRQGTAINDRVKGVLHEIDLKKQGVNATALSRINSLQRGVKPDLLMAGISVASSAIASDMKYGSDVLGLGAKAQAMGTGAVALSTEVAPMPTIDGWSIDTNPPSVM